MIEFSVSNGKYIILDRLSHARIEVDREGLRQLARSIMVELNVVEFTYRENETFTLGHEIDVKFKEMVKRKWGKY